MAPTSPPPDASANIGAIVAVRGSVVDVRFAHTLPPINTLLRTGDSGKILLEVWAQLDANRVRAIAMTPTRGLERGMAVEDTGAPLLAPVGKAIRSRMFDVFGQTIDGGPRPSDVAVALDTQTPAAAGGALDEVGDSSRQASRRSMC